MEKRTAKINISSAGGTASPNAKTYKLTLPNSWMAALGINDDFREMEIEFKDMQIILSRKSSIEELIAQHSNHHDVRLFKYFNGKILCTTIYADFTDEKITIENHINDPVNTAFGNNDLPIWDDFLYFLQERCIPKQRAGLREYLETIGVDEFDPFEIIKKTTGRMAEDDQWIEMESMK